MINLLYNFKNYIQLSYKIYNYISYYNVNQNHNELLLDEIIHNINRCGSIAIKFTQWITPKLELIYTEENNLLNKNRIKPLWLRKFENFSEITNIIST